MSIPASSARPAFLGGSPAFPEGLPLVRPRVPDPNAVGAEVTRILESGTLTNGPFVRRLEEAAQDYLGVRHCIAVSSCTSGLMLTLRAADLTGDVIVPSFTFAATAHAVQWNGLRPVFVDVDAETLTLSASAVERAIGIRTSAILATHLYGAPCDVDALARVVGESGIRLFFDAAHAFGSRRGDRMVGGFGDAEVFSLSPTKVLVAGEGGIIATNDDLLAERCRIGRDYGNPGDYDCRFVGLNARMSELHAAVALASLSDLEERLAERLELASAYRSALHEVDGITFPMLRDLDRSTFKDLTILVRREGFGMDADALQDALHAEGIETKRYYSPPVHRMVAYRTHAATNDRLPVTELAASRALSLPLWNGMRIEDVLAVASAIARIAAAKTEDFGA
jgi:dTDP-4-amino-4,6-dideoxygalactose transaminase